MGAKRPCRLMSSSVANQKIFSVCFNAALRSVPRRRSEWAATSTRKRLCWKSVWNSWVTASWRYRAIFLSQTLRVSVPRSTSQNRQWIPKAFFSSKYPSGISGVCRESTEGKRSQRRHSVSRRGIGVNFTWSQIELMSSWCSTNWSPTKSESLLRWIRFTCASTASAPFCERQYKLFVPPARVPRKNRFRSPARTSCRSRVLARVVELKPAIFLAISRSISRPTASSLSSIRSREVSTILFLSFPAIEHLLCGLFLFRTPRLNFLFDFAAQPCKAFARTLQQVPEIGVRDFYLRDFNLSPCIVAAFGDRVSLGQVLEKFGQRLSPIEHRCYCHGIIVPELERNVGADGLDGGAHVVRKLSEVLVGRDKGDAELPRFRKQDINV